ncbi:MAG: patatin-like phospholipase family protein [Bacteroidales bacterium]|nr:patatin-like phospholipase family protein [Bacteroidales bacterium]MBN2633937.1 patatin-like phospholipase family protein [Bacteroidales bacterium]
MSLSVRKLKHEDNTLYACILKKSAAIIVLAVLTASFLNAQEDIKRPKLGLALSGGGSLGIAHLGVLKVMEEEGLRPDCISGVSMGSVIGGFYSTGYSTDSILSILKSEDLNEVIMNKIQENKITFLEKKNFHNSIASIPISLKKVNLPSGLTNGQVIENFLSFYAWPAATINDFSKLPIPFVCVASDILTASVVDLKGGYLPQAIRASLAIPSVFTPVKKDTNLLVDGGVFRNFAAEEVIELGADIVIGSYTGFLWKDEEELDNVSNILKQLVFSMGYNDFEKQKKLTDYLILPDLKGFSSMDFSNVDSIYGRGYKAAEPFRSKFRRLADSLNNLGPQKVPENIMNRNYYVFDRIEIRGNRNYSDRQITGILNVHDGDSVNNHDLLEKIDLLYGKNWFEKVNYTIEPKDDSLILIIECNENPEAMLFGSLHYDNTIGSGALLSLSARNFIFPGTWLNINTFLGRYYRVSGFLLQYLGWQQKNSLSLNFNYEKTPVPVLHIGNETGQVILYDFSTGLSLSRSPGLNHLVTISGNYVNRNINPAYVSDSRLKNISYNIFSTCFSYKINSLDTKYFPNKGTLLDITAGRSVLLSSAVRTHYERINYDKADPGNFDFEKNYTLRWGLRQYFQGGKKTTIGFRSDIFYVSRCDSAVMQNNYHFLGGLQSVSERTIPMTGFETSEIPVKKAAGIGFEIDIEPANQLHLFFTTDLFAVQCIYHEKEYRYIAGIGLGAGYMTFLGPIRAGISYGKNPYNEWFGNLNGYLSIGFDF